MEISRLALAVERQAAVEARAPSREPARLQLVGEEGAIGIVDLGDVEVEEGAAQADDVPEEGDDRQRSRPASADQVAPAPGPPLEERQAAGRSDSDSPLDTTAPRWLGSRYDDLKTIELGRIAPVRFPDRREGRPPVDPLRRSDGRARPPGVSAAGRDPDANPRRPQDQQLTTIRPEPADQPGKRLGYIGNGMPTTRPPDRNAIR